jgi:hypothetical protein
MLAAPNAFVNDGVKSTVVVVDVAGGAPGPLVVRVEVVLTWVPAATARTFRLMVQEPLAGIVPPVRDTEVEPGAAVAVPPQLSTSALGVATTNPVGSVSVNAALVRALLFGFVSVNVRLVVVPTVTVDAPNAFANVGGAT